MSSKWIAVITLSIITVVVWIGLQVFFSLFSKDIETDYTLHLTPLQPTLDENVIEEINARDKEFMLLTEEDLE